MIDTSPIVHVLRNGNAVCGFELGKDWPEGHKWVGCYVLAINFPPGHRLCPACATELRKPAYVN